MANVLVSHSVKYNESGNVVGTHYVHQARRVVRIEHEYKHRAGGNMVVRTETGDIFPVVQKSGIFNGKVYDYQTVAE